MDRVFLLYDDEGAGEFSLQAAQTYFSRFATIRPVKAADIIQACCFDDAAALIMPGGADRPYARKLQGPGNAAIRNFVEQGGLYIGLCAGAYYGCREIDFHKGRADEICEERELSFYQGTASGSLPDLAPYYDDTLSSAAIVGLTADDNKSYTGYYFGGCLFSGDEDVAILARYADLADKPPAIILKKIGRGRALLSGVHFEVMPAMLKHYYSDKAPDDKSRAEKLALALSHGDTIDTRLESIWA